MKKLLSVALAAVLALSMVACGGKPEETKAPETTKAAAETAAGETTAAVKEEAPAMMAGAHLSGEYDALPADGETYNLTVGYASAENTINHKVMSALKEALEYYSDGKINVALYPNAQLGSDAEMIASCVAGDIDLVYQCGSTHATFVPETQIFDTPFLFSGVDFETLEAVMLDSEFRDIYNAANEEAGMKLLMLVGAETMDLTSNSPVYSLADLQGLKIRTAQSESRMKIWDVLGANPTPLAYSELYMALQNGTVEASDNIYSNHVSGAFYEQQKYVIPTDHFVVSMDLTMNLDTFNAMPAEYQNLIEKICSEIHHYYYEVTVADIENNLNALINEHGLELCEISDEFRAEIESKKDVAVDAAKQLVGNDEIYAALDRSLGR